MEKTKKPKKESIQPVTNKKMFCGDTQDRIDACLTCKKPASKCKGQCFGRL